MTSPVEQWTDQQWEDLHYRVSTVFTPTTPVGERDLFAGRRKQLDRVVDALQQPGQHVIVFGERGVGKTSLANVLSQFLTHPTTQVIAPRVNCDTTDTYGSVWRKVMKRIDLVHIKRAIGFGDGDRTSVRSAAAMLANQRVTPDEVQRVADIIGSESVLILIVDEFDRLGEKPRRAFADTVKTFSDHAIRATIVLVGVADSVDQLIDEHRSVGRALVQIQMPRMNADEVASILDTGMIQLGMSIDSDARQRISALAQGLPHYAHLMGQHAARAAIASRTLRVSIESVNTAIKTAIADAQQSIRSAYHTAIVSARKDNLFADVLLACALARPDELGYFSAADVRVRLREIRHKDYQIASFAQHLSDFCDSKRDNILTKTGPTRRIRYRFADPLMQPFVIMQGVVSGKIQPESLEE